MGKACNKMEETWMNPKRKSRKRNLKNPKILSMTSKLTLIKKERDKLIISF